MEGKLKPKLSDFLFDLHRSLAQQGLQKSSTYPWVCLCFLRTLLHQDLGTSLRNKSLNLGYNTDGDVRFQIC